MKPGVGRQWLSPTGWIDLRIHFAHREIREGRIMFKIYKHLKGFGIPIIYVAYIHFVKMNCEIHLKYNHQSHFQGWMSPESIDKIMQYYAFVPNKCMYISPCKQYLKL